jgi:nitroreductase
MKDSLALIWQREVAEMIELLRARRSIRRYTDRRIEPEKVEILRAPSSRNIDPWEFVFVDDRKLLARLALCKPHGAKFLEQAALGIVICADGQESDVWIEDCSIASILVQMVAQSIGLGSCWIQIRNRTFNEQVTSEDYIRDVLSMPDHIKVECIVAIGYPAETREPLWREDLKGQKIRINGF